MKNITWAIVFSTLLVIGISCSRNEYGKESHTIPTLELLISLADMPSGWQVEQEPQYLDKGYRFFAEEGAAIVFIADTTDRIATAYRVYRYATVKAATKEFDIEFVHFATGSNDFIPDGWSSPSLYADASQIGCTLHGSRMNCVWTARYDEYIVLFTTWIGPDAMALKDFERLVIQSDKKIYERLNE
ncbi:hypothetical protein D6779_02660 [Candidatus Parcubacteria bacterium]|nr:MAG: hypothetical protein D6779_02660 [Candidatus Parcubacteria bacterium]